MKNSVRTILKNVIIIACIVMTAGCNKETTKTYLNCDSQDVSLSTKSCPFSQDEIDTLQHKISSGGCDFGVIYDFDTITFKGVAKINSGQTEYLADLKIPTFEKKGFNLIIGDDTPITFTAKGKDSVIVSISGFNHDFIFTDFYQDNDIISFQVLLQDTIPLGNVLIVSPSFIGAGSIVSILMAAGNSPTGPVINLIAYEAVKGALSVMEFTANALLEYKAQQSYQQHIQTLQEMCLKAQLEFTIVCLQNGGTDVDVVHMNNHADCKYRCIKNENQQQ